MLTFGVCRRSLPRTFASLPQRAPRPLNPLLLQNLRTMSSTSTHPSLSIVSTESAYFHPSHPAQIPYPRRFRFADAPAAIGPYSQAIKAGDLVFLSGCIPLVPSTMQVAEGGIEAQTRQALANFKAVLEASGSEVGKVVKTTVRGSC
jgi:hypothetical protein